MSCRFLFFFPPSLEKYKNHVVCRWVIVLFLSLSSFSQKILTKICTNIHSSFSFSLFFLLFLSFLFGNIQESHSLPMRRRFLFFSFFLSFFFFLLEEYKKSWILAACRWAVIFFSFPPFFFWKNTRTVWIFTACLVFLSFLPPVLELSFSSLSFFVLFFFFGKTQNSEIQIFTACQWALVFFSFLFPRENTNIHSLSFLLFFFTFLGRIRSRIGED